VGSTGTLTESKALDMDHEKKASPQATSATRADTEGGDAFASRRRVIRGAVGLPAIVTLASGRAASAASILVCALNESSQPSDSDTDVILYNADDPDHREIGTDYFDTGDGTAVRYRSDGTLVLVDPDGEGGSDPVPVVQSCYASFAATG
jgi:hypothetical protein